MLLGNTGAPPGSSLAVARDALGTAVTATSPAVQRQSAGRRLTPQQAQTTALNAICDNPGSNIWYQLNPSSADDNSNNCPATAAGKSA